VILRAGGPNDVRFLRDMLRHAYADVSLVDELPVSRYVDRWGRPGDLAVIALEGATPVGATWFRLYRARAPGFGFVDEETPELSLAVVPSRRRGGVGKALLTALLDKARKGGHHRLSLSVGRTNPAIGLYERFGFSKVGETEGAYTMVAELGPEPQN